MALTRTASWSSSSDDEEDVEKQHQNTAAALFDHVEDSGPTSIVPGQASMHLVEIHEPAQVPHKKIRHSVLSQAPRICFYGIFSAYLGSRYIHLRCSQLCHSLDTDWSIGSCHVE
jgi:hypothetical protein